MSSAYLKLLIFLPVIFNPPCDSSSLAFHMMYSAYKLNKQGENIWLWWAPFPIWNQSIVSCPVMSCCFLACIQVSQEPGNVVCDLHLFQNFPQFLVIHAVKIFSIVNETEVDVFFWNSLAFSMIQWILAIWSLVPLPFLNPACTSGSSKFTYHWSLAWGIISITLILCEMSAIMQQFQHSLALPFFGIGMKTDLFQSCGHCWVFQICWAALSQGHLLGFGIAGIPSPPLVLFMQKPSWLRNPWCLVLCEWSHHNGLLATKAFFFIHSSSLSFCHLFLISSAYLRSYHFCPLLSSSLHDMFLWYLIFLKRSLVFLIILFSSVSLHWSLKKTSLPLLAIP